MDMRYTMHGYKEKSAFLHYAVVVDNTHLSLTPATSRIFFIPSNPICSPAKRLDRLIPTSC